MQESKPVKVPILIGVKLSANQFDVCNGMY
jgi:hypothetical protein